MQDLVAERKFYDDLFERNPDNEHITAGYEELHDMAFPTVPDGLVLDLGCGTGAHSIRLARRGLSMVSMDLSHPGVKAARDRFRKEGLTAHFVVGDAEHLPFRDGAMAAIWASLLLHHFPKLDRLPEELARVTRDRLVALEANGHNGLSWFAFNVVNPIVGLSTTTKNQRALYAGRLNRRMEQAGFRTEMLRYVHRAWQDSKGAFSIVRRTYDAVARLLPERFRANKFLVVYQKQA